MEQKSFGISLNSQGKSIIVAYLLWWFLGWAGIHRFYLGKTSSGISQLIIFILGWATSVILIGWVFLFVWGIWWCLDAYLVQKYVREINSENGIANSSVTFNTYTSSTNNLDQLEKLHSLFEKGVITKEEYEAKKSQLL